MKLYKRTSFWLCAGAALAVCAGAAWGADWPQYRGPNQDGVAPGRLATVWTRSMTNPVWEVSLGAGLGGLAVSQERVFTLVKRTLAEEEREVCVALKASTGAELWATPFDTAYYPQGGTSGEDGPRSTPTVTPDGVFVLGAYLKLARLNAADGSVVWQRDLVEEYGGVVIPWQNAASPVVENGLVFVNGNAGTERLMAFRVADGSLAWRSQDEPLSHSTPVLATIHGVRQLLWSNGRGLVSVDPASGACLWKQAAPFGGGGYPTISPVVSEDLVLMAMGSGPGAMVVEATLTNGSWAPRILWSSSQGASFGLNTPVCYQGCLYVPGGSYGYWMEMRTGNGYYMFFDALGPVALVRSGENLLCLGSRPDLLFYKARPEFQGSFAQLRALRGSASANRVWSAPAIAGSSVFIRGVLRAAAYDLPLPGLLVEPPQPAAPEGWRLAARAADGSPLPASRAASIQVLTSTNAALPPAQWTLLTNQAVLTNGAAWLDNLPAAGAPRQFFRLSEPE